MNVIDFRARPNTPEYMSIYEGRGWSTPSPQPLADFVKDLDRNRIATGVFTGRQGAFGWVSNEYIADCVAQYPDRLVGYAGIDPLRGSAALDEIDHAVGELGLRGLSLDPPDGPSDPRGRGYDDERLMYPLYEKAEALRAPIILTVGPFMTPFANPRTVERIAADFPNLVIICSHGGWPSVTEWIGLAYRYSNVVLEPSIYIFLPGGSALVEAGNTILKDQMLYASAFPFGPLNSIDRFQRLGFTDDALQQITQGNASRILGPSVLPD